ncbi:ImmA/IrrE family metallo-endopeptidase [Microbacterium maritypicum]|uniref:ImmA/IrrE family metallo-endopeptidase n=1 Tax=Microbacterium maritypicum TaxID=33918 RepID=UPI003825FADF
MLDALGVSVEFCEMPPDDDGEYDHDTRILKIQHDLLFRRYVSTLAHETCHAIYGDVKSKFGPVNAKQERRADEWAALFLIALEDYRREESRHDGHVDAMAIALNVTVDLIDAFRRILLRVGDTVYLGPKMGAGRFTDRVEVA